MGAQNEITGREELLADVVRTRGSTGLPLL
jgi:hypothetical protein